MGKVILHIDLNAFFANAEIIKNPKLKGKPLAISGNTRRSVVSTCSYEARKYGVKSAMSIIEAKRLCPQLVIINGNHQYYDELSNQFIKLLSSYSNKIEQASIDECYMDITDEIGKYAKPLDLPFKIQHEVLNKLHLPCSIGIAPNKFLAKMASDMKKPMGITILRIKEVEAKLWPLKIEEMRGVGKKTALYLHKLNINTIGDLANYSNLNDLYPIFGKNTEDIIAKAHGKDNSEIITNYECKSLSTSTTLNEDLTDYDELKTILATLSRDLSKRLKHSNVAGKTLTLTIKYYDFKTITRSKKLAKAIFQDSVILEEILNIFDQNYNDTPIRLLGIGLQDLVNLKELNNQIDLFNFKENEIEYLINKLNKQLNHGNLKLLSEIEVGDKNEA